MSIKLRNSIIIITLILVTAPFILMTDIFPFMRFGMFSEPIKADIQTETFYIQWTNNKGITTTLHPEEINFDPKWFHYLTRNYYYRNESELLLKKILSLNHLPEISKISLYKITWLELSTEKADTLLVKTLNYEK